MSWRPRRKHIGTRHGRYGLEYRYKCPRCRHDNLWWIPGRNGGVCWTCVAIYGKDVGNLTLKSMRTLFSDFSEQDAIADLVAELNHTPSAPKSAPTPSPLAEGEEWHWKVRWFLEKERRCSLHDCARSGVWYDANEDRVHFPLSPTMLRSGRSDVIPTMSRTPDAKVKDWRFGPRTANKQEYWFNPMGLSSGSLILVEGPFDVLASGLLGSALALCGTQLHEDAQYWFCAHRAEMQSVILWLDPDEAGQAATKKIAKQLSGIVPVLTVSYDKEPGDCTPDEVKEVLNSYDTAKLD